MAQPGSHDSDETSSYQEDPGEAFDGAEFDGMASAADDADTDDESLEEGFDSDEHVDELDAAGTSAMDESLDDADGAALHGWKTFEAELADALDEEQADGFAARMLTGLMRASGQSAASAGEASPGEGQPGADAAELTRVARALAPLLGASAASAGLAGQRPDAGDEMPAEPGIANRLAWMRGRGAAEADAFDEMVDAYEDGAIELLPVIVGLAARGLADGLGRRSVEQLPPATRRALVRSVAAASRRLVGRHGADGARVVGRLATVTGRAAARGAATPAQAAQRAIRALPRVAQGLAQDARSLQRIGRRPLTVAPSLRSRRVRAGQPSRSRAAPAAVPSFGPPQSASAAQVLRLHGPIEIVIRQR